MCLFNILSLAFFFFYGSTMKHGRRRFSLSLVFFSLSSRLLDNYLLELRQKRMRKKTSERGNILFFTLSCSEGFFGEIPYHSVVRVHARVGKRNLIRYIGYCHLICCLSMIELRHFYEQTTKNVKEDLLCRD